MALSDKQYFIIEGIMKGKRISSIAKETGIPRSNIYYWLKSNEEFKSELDTLRKEVQTSTKEHIENRVRIYIDELEELALNKETSSKVRIDGLKYLINRVLGNTTTKVEVTGDDKEKEKEVDLDELTEQLKAMQEDKKE